MNAVTGRAHTGARVAPPPFEDVGTESDPAACSDQFHCVWFPRWTVPTESYFEDFHCFPHFVHL